MLNMFKKNKKIFAPFFGFLDNMPEPVRGTVLQTLTSKSMDTLPNHTIGSDVVEEIIRRGGTFYTAEEAKYHAPFPIDYDDVFFASFKFLDDEPRPANPNYGDLNWCVLHIHQYCYGVYLVNAINDGKLTLEDIKTVKVYA